MQWCVECCGVGWRIGKKQVLAMTRHRVKVKGTDDPDRSLPLTYLEI
jgi:hypothetical protein